MGRVKVDGVAADHFISNSLRAVGKFRAVHGVTAFEIRLPQFPDPRFRASGASTRGRRALCANQGGRSAVIETTASSKCAIRASINAIDFAFFSLPVRTLTSKSGPAPKVIFTAYRWTAGASRAGFSGAFMGHLPSVAGTAGFVKSNAGGCSPAAAARACNSFWLMAGSGRFVMPMSYISPTDLLCQQSD